MLQHFRLSDYKLILKQPMLRGSQVFWFIHIKDLGEIVMGQQIIAGKISLFNQAWM